MIEAVHTVAAKTDVNITDDNGRVEHFTISDITKESPEITLDPSLVSTLIAQEEANIVVSSPDFMRRSRIRAAKIGSVVTAVSFIMFGDAPSLSVRTLGSVFFGAMIYGVNGEVEPREKLRTIKNKNDHTHNRIKILQSVFSHSQE